jgi:outer membrane protein
LVAGLILGVAACTVQAQTKLATINMKSVFDGYWRTKQSDATIKERQAEYEKDRKKMADDYEKLNADYRKLDESSRDAAVSPEEQKKRKESANSKLLEIREIEQSVRNFDQTFRAQVADQIKRMRENIMRDIRELVDAKSRSAGYGLVLDVAAEGASQTPVVLFVNGLPDLTQEILTELNAKAPAGALDEKKPAADEKKPAEGAK